MKLLAKNKRATYDYNLTQRLTAGVSLTGSEVKSIKAGNVSLKGAFIALRSNEAFLINAHVTPYKFSNAASQSDPLRGRKLLMHRRELNSLVAHKQSGLSIVPTALLLEGRLIKLELGIGQGKKRFDKREVIKRREVNRELQRQFKAS